MLVSLSLTTQVTDQWKFAGQLPEWSDSEEPVQVGTCNLPVIKWQVLDLLFSTAIFHTLPIAKTELVDKINNHESFWDHGSLTGQYVDF